MTNSPAAGTNAGPRVIGRRAFVLLAVALTLANAIVASVSVTADLGRRGVVVRPAEPWIWELSSALALLVWLAPLLWFDDALRARVVSLAARLGVRVLVSIVYSALHVATMVGLRHAAYAAAGWQYHFGPWVDGFVYEYRKDALTYAVILAIAAVWRAYEVRARAAVSAPAVPAAAPAQADAVDNAAPAFLVRTARGDVLVRTPEIDWIEAQGNYVALHVQGRALLMRQTLAELETQLAGHGFVRSHRGALVNGARVQAIVPRSGGELGVRLASGEVAPLSESRRAQLVQRVLGAAQSSAGGLAAPARRS